MTIKKIFVFIIATLFLVPLANAQDIYFDFEEFDQIDQWNELAGIWDVYEGFFTEILDADGPLIAATGDSTLSDYTLMVRAKGLVADSDWGLAFRIQDIDNFYSWQFVNGTLQFIKYYEGNRSSLFSMDYPEVLDEWQVFKVVAEGDTFELYFDDELMATVTDGDITEGQVGLFSWVNSGTELGDIVGYTAFDNFYVTDQETWSIKRTVPVSLYQPGETIEGVQLNLNILLEGETVSELNVTDSLPEGFTATNFNASVGQASFSNGEVTWTADNISEDATLTYDVETPADTSGGHLIIEGIANDGMVFKNIATSLIALSNPLDEELIYDFEDAAQADDWEVIAGEWAIQNGYYYELLDAGGPLATVTGNPNASDYTVITESQGLVTGADWGVILRFQDIGNFYSWQFVNDTLAFIKYVDGSSSTLFSVAQEEILNELQEFKVVAQGNSFECYFDGELITTVTDNDLPTGRVGLFGWVNEGSPVGDAGGGIAYNNFFATGEQQWTVQRTVPSDTYFPAQTLEGVQVDVNVAEGETVESLTVTENIPNGVEVLNLSANTGEPTLSDNIITWNLENLSTSASMTYDLQTPDNAVFGPITLTGMAQDNQITKKTNPNTISLVLSIPLEDDIVFDFETAGQADEWNDLAGEWDVSDGEFYELIDAGGPLVSLTGPNDVSDYDISVRAMGLVEGADWGIVFRAQDIDNFYSWQFVNGSLALIMYEDANRSTLFSVSQEEVLNEWQDFQVIARSNVYELYFNGELIETVENSTHATGAVGLFGWVNEGSPVGDAGGGIVFDDFAATVPTAVETWMVY